MAKVDPPGFIGPMTFVGWINRLVEMHNEHEDEIEELKRRIAELESGRAAASGNAVAEKSAKRRRRSSK